MTDEPQPSLLQVAAIALRESAAVHDAVQIPHLSPVLLALADALDAYTPPGPPPGRCGAPGFRIVVGGQLQPPVVSCDLLAGHIGQHEGRYYPPVPGLEAGVLEHWDDPATEVADLDLAKAEHAEHDARDRIERLRALLAEVATETPDGESPWLWTSDVLTVLDGPGRP